MLFTATLAARAHAAQKQKQQAADQQRLQLNGGAQLADVSAAAPPQPNGLPIPVPHVAAADSAATNCTDVQVILKTLPFAVLSNQHLKSTLSQVCCPYWVLTTHVPCLHTTAEPDPAGPDDDSSNVENAATLQPFARTTDMRDDHYRWLRRRAEQTTTPPTLRTRQCCSCLPAAAPSRPLAGPQPAAAVQPLPMAAAPRAAISRGKTSATHSGWRRRLRLLTATLRLLRRQVTNLTRCLQPPLFNRSRPSALSSPAANNGGAWIALLAPLTHESSVSRHVVCEGDDDAAA